MAHAQKPDFVFRRNGRVHLNRQGGGGQFSRLLAAEVCASAVVMLDTPCSEVECKTAGYPLHSPYAPSLPRPCVTVCHYVSTGLYPKSVLDLQGTEETGYEKLKLHTAHWHWDSNVNSVGPKRTGWKPRKHRITLVCRCLNRVTATSDCPLR